MKTIGVAVTLIMFCFVTINAQIPNSSFENWSNNSPEGWSSNSAGTSGYITIIQSTDAAAGTSSVKLEVATFLGIDVGPILWAGTLENSGFSVSEKYESLSGFYKFTKTNDDILSIVVTMSSNGTIIGEGTLDISSGASAYTPFNIELNYIGSSAPDTCNIYFVIASEDSNSAAHLGSSALVDNLSFNSTTSITDILLTAEYALSQNYPNPFNPSTIINYSIAEQGFASLKVFDALGKEMAILVNGEKSAGNHIIEFNAENLSSGIYFYQLSTPEFIQTKKMILLR